MHKTVMHRYLAFIVLVLCCTSLFAKENDYTTQIDSVLRRLIEEYPPSDMRLPISFSQNTNVQQLIQIINSDFELYLSVTHMIPPDNHRAPELSEEERAFMAAATSSSGIAWRSARGKRTEEEYRLFTAKLDSYMERTRVESRKQQILINALELWAVDQKALLIKHLNHHNWRIRAIARSLLFQFVPEERDVIDALLKTLPPKYPWYDDDVSGEKGFLVECPVMIVERLSYWRIPEVLPYVQKLGQHPFYHYRRDSMKYIKQYGVHESIPHMIKLLDDGAGLVRAEAFDNLALLTGTGMGQRREFWYNDDLKSDQKAEAITAWTEWWAKHGEGIDDVEFHRAAVERAFVLMEKHGPWDFSNKCPAQPIGMLQEHLNSGISTRQKSDDVLVSEFQTFWKQNKELLHFDRIQQKFVVQISKKDTLQQEAPADMVKPRR